MLRLLEKLAQSAKGDNRYRLDPQLGLRNLWSIVSSRTSQLFRGLWWRWTFASCRGLLFVGRGVIIENAHQLYSRGTLTIRDYVSIQALSAQGIHFGANVMIGRYTTIECTGVIRALGDGLWVGDNSNFGEYNFIGVRGPIEIGNDVLFGPRVSLHAENHIFLDISKPIRLQGEDRKGIKIEDECWLGSGVIVLDGVTIGKGSVVAAGSVVTNDVPAYSVVAGIPAKVIKQREREL